MKSGPGDLGTVQNESESKKVKSGPDALGMAENEFGSAKLENRTRRTR
jgi:hypothetical protein